MTRLHAEVLAPRGTIRTVHGNDAGYTGKRKARPFVVAVVKCSICHIRRTCVNDVCAVCAASLE